MNNTPCRSALVALLLLGNLSAQELAPQTFELEALSISASPIHEHTLFDIPAQVDLITQQEVASKMSASLGEILSDISGVNNLSTGSQAGKPVIRGMNGERVKVLSNGAATDFQTYGIRHISNTDTFLSEHIEVVRGAQGVLYGSDALGGVVNIISPEILSTKEGEYKVHGEVLSEYHTNNEERVIGAKMQSASGKFGTNVALIKREANNLNTPDADTWEVGEASGNLPRFAGELPYTNFETTSALVALGYHDNWGNLSLQHTYWESFQNYLGHTAAPTYSAVASAGQELTNNETQLRGEFLAGEWILKPSLSRTLNRRRAATNVAYESMNESNIDLDIEVDRVDGKLSLVHPQIGPFDGEIGVEGYDKEQIVRAGHLVPNADETGKAVYLFEEADIGRWIFQWGLRYDTKEVDADVSTNAHQTFSALGGSLGATYKLTDNWNIATNLSRGFRAPSIFELYADGVHGGVQAYQSGNANLAEETTLGGDLSLRYHNEKNNGEVTLYRTYIDNYIYLANTGNLRNAKTGALWTSGTKQGYLPEMSNRQSDALMEGIEFSFDTYLTDSTQLDGAIEIIHGKNRTNDNPLTMMPANNVRLALHQHIGSLSYLRTNILSLTMKAVDDQQIAGSYEPFAQYSDKTKIPFGSADTAGYVLWGIGYEGEVANKKALLGVKVDNLFDTKYRDFLDTYKGYTLGMGRNISFSLRIPF